jgi:hypothetical protein
VKHERQHVVRLSDEQMAFVEQVALDHRAAIQERALRYALPDERDDVGRRVNPETAHVFFRYAYVVDPYGDHPDLPEELCCVGRMFFAVDPKEGIAVSFDDLPKATLNALRDKQDGANRAGWKRLGA